MRVPPCRGRLPVYRPLQGFGRGFTVTQGVALRYISGGPFGPSGEFGEPYALDPVFP